MAKRNVSDHDREALWADLEIVGAALLRGEPPPADRRARVNEALAALADPHEPLPEERRTEPGATARLVACSAGINDFCGLWGAVGLPASEAWRARYLAACSYDAITSEDEAFRRLPVSEHPLGEAAALARLLVHYPIALYRDGVFLALAGLEAEAWNGHAFVAGFNRFAEHAHQAGFTLAVFEEGHEGAFHEAIGYHPSGAETSLARDGWAAECFLDLDGSFAPRVESALEEWFGSAGATGARLRAEADGTWRLTAYRGGTVVADPPWRPAEPDRLGYAATRLDLRASLAFLGLPDLLEPAAFTPPREIV